eukprot:CAMPEP_0118853582 /NCGR_PEP_ID=MMETSP1163-20130328/2113_1 /TAXON_ID=124430 /ORGANISM="Phaeomonas parva, Strain CCMP2877" /LENGTH=335 /DNA_ID=CAMNT_0006786153 /DNA_START=220 /DNA_END=1227 /DNA_ORIENTATION=+
MLRRGAVLAARAARPCEAQWAPLRAAAPQAARTLTQWSAPRSAPAKPMAEEKIADHSWRQQNHIWTEEEIADRMATKDEKHKPVTFGDHLASGVMKGLYWSFNAVTGYTDENPTPQAIEWRLIILESFAGVPGFLAAGFRHFYSLRTLQRDHGAIYTFLEEAENERMHLLVCLKMFDAGIGTRALVIAAQVGMTPLLMATYAVSPATMHRFVGYLEETAVHTYANIVKHCEMEGSHLHAAWAHLPAPEIAKSYWALEDDASWTTCLKHMLADEAHHRDVNHTFATLPEGAENPFIKEHMENFDAAVMRRTEAVLRNALEASGKPKGTESRDTPLA